MTTPPETVTPPATPAPGDSTFTKADVDAAIEKGRKEAHDRLYGQLDSEKAAAKAAQEELAVLKKADEARQADDKRRSDEAAAAIKAGREGDMDAKALLAERTREWETQRASDKAEVDARLAQLQREGAEKDLLLQHERDVSELRDYIRARVDAEGDAIMPDLADFIGGDTKEAVEVSIANVKARSASILEGVRSVQTAQRAATPGASVTAGNIGFEDASGSTETLTAEQIRDLPLSDPRWAALRAKYIPRSSQGRGAGLTGRLDEAARRLFYFVRNSQPPFEYLGPGCRPNPSSRDRHTRNGAVSSVQKN